MPDIYREVYHSERTEIFFKATPSRTVGPGEAAGIRGDSGGTYLNPNWASYSITAMLSATPSATTCLVAPSRDKIPFTSRRRRCTTAARRSIPCVTSDAAVSDPHDLEMSMTITRDGEEVFEGSTTTNKAQTCEDIVSYLNRHNAVPELAVLMTETAIVPNESFTLQANDQVSIDLEAIGTLENDVTVVSGDVAPVGFSRAKNRDGAAALTCGVRTR